MRNILCLLFSLYALSACASVKPSVDFDALLRAEGIDPARAALLITRLDDGRAWSHGGPRVDERFVAASTSKIPHTFIALEHGYVTGPETVFKWDGTQRWAQSWNQDQTLASAYARSAVWVFQDIARTLGSDAMGASLRSFHYGNYDVGTIDDVTTYWLSGPLQISAREQVKFLTALSDETLPLKPQTYVAGKAIMQSADIDGRYAKTGWYHSDIEQDIGWYVGWQNYGGEDASERYVFAFNMDMDDPDFELPKRIRAVEAALTAVRHGK